MRNDQRFIISLCIALIFLFAFDSRCAGQATQSFRETSTKNELKSFNFVQIHMAMPVRLTVWSDQRSEASKVCRSAFARVSDLESVFSDYRKDSEVNRLLESIQRSSDVPVEHCVSDEMMAVLLFSRKVYQQSRHRFDPTAAPIIELWKDAIKKKAVPKADSISALKKHVGFDQIQLVPSMNKIVVSNPEVKFDFGAVAKGFICDQVVALIQAEGISSVRVEAGGDVVLGDAPPGEKGWEINTPFGTMWLENCAVSISGDSVQNFESAGKTYSHVVDPLTGNALTNRITTMVIAPSGIQSDALATCGSLMSEIDFARLVDGFEKVRYRRERLR